MAASLIDADAPAKRLIAIRAHDADHLLDRLCRRGTKPFIAEWGNRDVVYSLNRRAYRTRNIIERMFERPKDRQRIATRYGRLAKHMSAPSR